MHLDNAKGIIKYIIITEEKNITEDINLIEDINVSKDNKTSTSYCKICNIRYNYEKKHHEADEHEKMLNPKKLLRGSGERKLMS